MAMDRRLIWLAAGAFATSTVAFVFAGLLPLISASANVSIAEAGHLMTVFSLSYAIATPILSTLFGAVDRRRVIALALLSFISGNALAAASGSYLGLLGAQIVMGAAAGLFAATAQATAVALASPQHRARAVSTVLGGTTLAVAIGAPLGALIGNLAGWRATYLFVAALAFICLAVLWLRLPHGIAGVKLSLRQRVMVIGRPGVLPSLVVTFLYLTGGFAVICYFGPLATLEAGLPVSLVPAMLLVFGLGAIIGNYSSGQLADRLGATRLVALSLTGSILVCLLLTAVLEFAPDTLAGPLLIALMLPWGIVGWMFPPAQASRLVAMAPELASLTMPLNVSAMYFGIALGTFVGGQAIELAPPAELGLTAAVFSLAALGVFAVSTRRARRRSLQMG
jgi:predicted MFS family arabinose efflux permease